MRRRAVRKGPRCAASDRATQPATGISRSGGTQTVERLVELRERGYGYLWWVVDYPWRGRTVRAFFAGGNGGQLVIGIPELDLAIAFVAGNYSDRVFCRIQGKLVPGYVLPAVGELPRPSPQR